MDDYQKNAIFWTDFWTKKKRLYYFYVNIYKFKFSWKQLQVKINYLHVFLMGVFKIVHGNYGHNNYFLLQKRL